MDKSWIALDRLSREYEEGVHAFLAFAQSNLKDATIIPCPCAICINVCHRPYDDVRYHLFSHGFDEMYKVWKFHGEKKPKIYSASSTTSRHPDFDYTTKEMLHDTFECLEKDPDSVKSLLEECEKPLYEGSKLNALSGLMKFQHLKGQFGWSNSSFKALLAVLREVLPENNTIPVSVYEANKLLKGIGIEYKKIHACENDCVLFWKEHEHASECPTCGTSRWKKNTTNVPLKVTKRAGYVAGFIPP